MKKRKTKKAYEEYLNELYEHTVYDYVSAVKEFGYFTNKSRGKFTSKSNIIKHYNNHQLGKLLRTYDPIAFNVGFNEWDGK